MCQPGLSPGIVSLTSIFGKPSARVRRSFSSTDAVLHWAREACAPASSLAPPQSRIWECSCGDGDGDADAVTRRANAAAVIIAANRTRSRPSLEEHRAGAGIDRLDGGYCGRVQSRRNVAESPPAPSNPPKVLWLTFASLRSHENQDI